jgi:enamine deaminase RidA (YjgF/YER057c/UK114 family)
VTRRIINPPQLVLPTGFAHAVAAGPFVYLGGQTALNKQGEIVTGGIVAQFVQAFTNVLTALTAAGGRPTDIVDMTLYLTDIPDYQAHGKEIGERWRELAGNEYPAMAGVGVTALWQPEALIEIQAVAYIGERA